MVLLQLQQLRVAQHRVHRRAQFVADAREEFRLGLARGFGTPARELEFAGPHALRLIGAHEQETERIVGRRHHAATGSEHDLPIDRAAILRALR